MRPPDEKRDQIMPINDKLDLGALKDALQHYHRSTGKPVTFEYLLFDGFNDHPSDAEKSCCHYPLAA